MSQCKLLSQVLWTQLCSSGLQSAPTCSNSDHRKWGRSGYCIFVVCVQPHGRIDFGFRASVLAAWISISGHVPASLFLESKWHSTRNILGVAQCCQRLWDLLVGCLLASPQWLAFSPLFFPQERQEGSSMCQALTWEPDLRRTCPICAVHCNRKTSVRHVVQDKVICESAYLRWIQFLILEGTQAWENCVYTHLSSLQSTHWATGCWRDPVSWMLSGGAWRLPAPHSLLSSLTITRHPCLPAVSIRRYLN